ncbi:4'-phosphopantetheinyl transferase family protein [Psychrobacter piechaudii]|uniref:4'-phosphopantetheinyl transferase sfp n=1 Tax=Psychrobacter piechaudii TaxID=1945521 RepID=A0A1R4GXD2_9GAMM|nr:4'-phosphopantetheinyl transferase superfamily protein [Psychrobacter piechaudii]SJM72857.1 4'-phosphopantetheinyl transferase sfp [Psychrobacter piechaudii]
MTADFTIKELSLSDIQYFGFDNPGHSSPLSSTNTCAVIAVSSFVYPSSTKYSANTRADSKIDNKPLLAKAQKYAVRKLLFKLIFEKIKDVVFTYIECNHVDLLKVSSLRLVESSYPYRLLPFNYYVCFTHSANKVACAMHTNKPIGIDLEINPVSMKVAQRYYTLEEKSWLSKLDNDRLPQALNLLWLLKEASIKQSKTNNKNLLSGLKKSKLIAAQQIMPVPAKEQYSATNISIINNKISTRIYRYQDLTDPKTNATYVYIASENLVAIW